LLLIVTGIATIAVARVSFKFARHAGLVSAHWEDLIVLVLSIGVFLPLVISLLRDFAGESLRFPFLFVIVCMLGDLTLDFTEELDALDDVWLIGKESRALDKARDLLGVASFVGLAVGVYVLAGRLAAVQRDRAREIEEKARLRHLVAMDRVQHVIAGADSVEDMLGGVLRELLDILDSDRAWLSCPCDPQVASVGLPFERTRPEFPGIGGRPDVALPLDAPRRGMIEKVLRTGEPLTRYGEEIEASLGREFALEFQIRGMMVQAVRPRKGPDWALGLHRCAHEHEWTDDDKRLLTEVGRRVEDALTTLLTLRDLSESESVLRNTLEELQRTQEQMIQKERLWALGQLASGVAHDFNNVLTVILGNAELLRLSTDDGVARRADQIGDAANRAAALTRQLLAFSRKQVFELADVDLCKLAAEAVELTRHLLEKHIELSFSCDCDEGDLPIRVDVAQLNQVVMNLAVNARDAMPHGGALKIAVSREDVDTDRGTVSHGVLAVSDSGTGIPAEIRPQIFEPFFTTKGPGQGTGLGLSMAHGTIEQLGGRITVDSEPGCGTTFKVALPLCESASEPRAAIEPGKRRESGGAGETILVVDDDPQVRTLVSDILSRHGYEVLETDCPRDALEIGASHDTVIELLITDVVMPGASGPELAVRMRQRRPRLRTLFMSGYAADCAKTLGLDATDSARFLQKPFAPSELLDRVRALLDTEPDGSASP